MPMAEGAWCFASKTHEGSREVALIGEAGGQRDLGQREVGLLDHMRGRSDTSLQDVMVGRNTYALPEGAGKVALGQLRESGQLTNVKAAWKCAVDVCLHATQGARRQPTPPDTLSRRLTGAGAEAWQRQHPIGDTREVDVAFRVRSRRACIAQPHDQAEIA
jgi:hypothetical protein